MTVNGPLWQPLSARIAESNLMHFIAYVEQRWGVSIVDYLSLYQWSIDEPEKFWESVWDFCDIKAETKGEVILENAPHMRHARFFPQARLNYAENLLRQSGDEPAIFFRNETAGMRVLSYDELTKAVARLAAGLKAAGLQPGERVSALMPNLPETVIAMLATAAVGGVWSSCSPDFGVMGVLDRFKQIEPKFLLCVDAYFYAGKQFDCLNKVKEIIASLPTVEKVIVIPYMTETVDVSSIPSAQLYEDFVAPFQDVPLSFTQVPFQHPLFIMFTSGTTGVPKCIVHSVGGTLLQHMKEHQLHCDIKPKDRVFYFTTCGWMMWNWQISALASKASLVLFDGSPMSPKIDILFDYADEVGVTLFGTSAKYINALKKAEVSAIKTHSLATVRMIASTGSPLMPESYDYVYEHIRKDVCLASISGGTDIIACFALGVPILPVWRGEIQSRGLGLKVDVFDECGKSIRDTKGELVCTAPFPSMPIGFCNDSEGKKYHEAYFAKFDNVWCHGDLVELKSTGGLIIYGRSDAVLNPGGVRIGTGEIYRQVEQLSEIVESLAVGQDWDNDVRIILFVKLKLGSVLTEELTDRIKSHIRINASPRHMPAKVIQVPDIPRTKSGKIVELAVRNLIHNRPVVNTEALANPEALEYFKNLPQLQE